MTVTRADKAKQFRSLRHLPLPTNPILPHKTLRWREQDSNHRSRAYDRVFGCC